MDCGDAVHILISKRLAGRDFALLHDALDSRSPPGDYNDKMEPQSTWPLS